MRKSIAIDVINFSVRYAEGRLEERKASLDLRKSVQEQYLTLPSFITTLDAQYSGFYNDNQ